MIGLNSPEFKVGVLVVTVSSIIGFMSLKVAEGPGVLTGQKRHSFVVEDAGGLVRNSAVKMAGIKVGVIENIELIKGKARVHLLLEQDVPVTTATKIELRADGILGDKHVELITEDLKGEPLEEGKQISEAVDRGSLDSLMKEVGKISKSLSELADNLNSATSGEGDNSTPIGRIILNIEKLTEDVSKITGRNKEKVNEIVDRVQSISKNLDTFIGDDSPDGFKAAWQKAIDSLSNIDRSLKNVEEITSKINNGQGTLGRLVNDEETIDKVNEAVDNVNEFLGGAGKLETSLDFHSEYLGDTQGTKSYVSLRIQPGLDRYYELGIVDDSNGLRKTTITDETDLSGGGGTTSRETVRTYKDRTKFNALFAKNFYDFTVKAGLLESSAGLGFDYYLVNRKLRLSLEAFDFEDLYLRAFAKYNLWRGIYLIGGGDNLLSEAGDNDLRNDPSYFVGGGIFITNDDLKLLASKFSF